MVLRNTFRTERSRDQSLFCCRGCVVVHEDGSLGREVRLKQLSSKHPNPYTNNNQYQDVKRRARQDSFISHGLG